MKTKNKAVEYTSPIIDEILSSISPTDLYRTEQRMLLAAKIADAIKIKGWKNIDLANKMKKNPSEISKWLSGTHNFTIDTLSDIEMILGIQLLNIGEKPDILYSYKIYVSSDLPADVGHVGTGNLINETAILYQNSKLLYSTDLSLKNK